MIYLIILFDIVYITIKNNKLEGQLFVKEFEFEIAFDDDVDHMYVHNYTRMKVADMRILKAMSGVIKEDKLRNE